MLIWYHGIAMGLFFPYIPKQVQKKSMYDVTMMSYSPGLIIDFAQTTDLPWNIGWNRQKSSKDRNFTGFFAYKKGNEVSNI